MKTALTQHNTEVGDAARWPRVRLGDVCEINIGRTPPRGVAECWTRTDGEGMVWLSIADLLNTVNGEVVSSKERITKTALDVFSVPVVKKGTFLLSFKLTLGRCAVAGCDLCTNEAIAALPFKDVYAGSVDLSYLCKYCEWFDWNAFAEKDEKVLGKTLNKKKLAEVPIMLPPLSIQREIVARLERELVAVDKLAKKFEELEASAEAEFKAELKETFEQIKHRGEMHRRSFASEGRFGEAEPEGRASVCETRRLGDVCERITKGTTPTSVGFAFTDTGVNFVKVESFSDDGDLIETRVAHVSRECHEALKRSQLKEGDVLFSIAGALGRVAKVDARLLPANTNQALAIIRLSSTTEIDIGYLMLALRGPSVSAQIDDMNKATAQANLSLQNVRDFEIPIPTLPVQREVVARLDAAKVKKEKLAAAARRGRETATLMRKAILKEAFE